MSIVLYSGVSMANIGLKVIASFTCPTVNVTFSSWALPVVSSWDRAVGTNAPLQIAASAIAAPSLDLRACSHRPSLRIPIDVPGVLRRRGVDGSRALAIRTRPLDP